MCSIGNNEHYYIRGLDVYKGNALECIENASECCKLWRVL